MSGSDQFLVHLFGAFFAFSVLKGVESEFLDDEVAQIALDDVLVDLEYFLLHLHVLLAGQCQEFLHPSEHLVESGDWVVSLLEVRDCHLEIFAEHDLVLEFWAIGVLGHVMEAHEGTVGSEMVDARERVS